MPQEEERGCCEHCRTTERTSGEARALINRLSRIEGQVRGLKGMVEKNAYCPDILIQAAAVSAAINSFSRELLAEHIKTCVVRDLHEGKDEAADELAALVQRLMK